MTKQTFDEQVITQYLLGSLPEDQAARFDELSFTDSEFAVALQNVENDLVDTFVRGELSGQSLDQFKSSYLVSPLRRKKVKFAEAFQDFAKKDAVQPAAIRHEASPERRNRLSELLSALKVFTVPRLAFQWGLASAALVLILAGGWLVFENIRRRERANQAQAEHSELQRKQELQTQPAGEGSGAPAVTATASPALPPEGAREPMIAQLIDGGGRVTLDREGKLSGVDHLPPAYQGMVKEALANQRIKRSSALTGLNRPTGSLMGGDEQGNKFSLTEPVGKVMLADRPTFRWSGLTGATGYIVEVYDEKFNLVVTSAQITSNSWTVLEPLKRGRIYSWQAKAIKDSQEFKSPRPPAPQARFRILDQATANELERAQRAHASSHLTLALLYADAGLSDEAEHELRTLQKANPNSAIVRRLLASVEAMRH